MCGVLAFMARKQQPQLLPMHRFPPIFKRRINSEAWYTFIVVPVVPTLSSVLSAIFRERTNESTFIISRSGLGTV